MNTHAAGAPAPTRKTVFTKFFSCNPQQDALFSVNSGVSAQDALDQASCFLAAAIGIMNEVAATTDTDAAWGVIYLVEMSKAIVDAANKAILHEERSHD